jgi:hypothetical protein
VFFIGYTQPFIYFFNVCDVVDIVNILHPSAFKKNYLIISFESLVLSEYVQISLSEGVSVWVIHFWSNFLYIIEYLIKLLGSLDIQPRETSGVITQPFEQECSSLFNSGHGKSDSEWKHGHYSTPPFSTSQVLYSPATPFASHIEKNDSCVCIH